MGRCGKRNLAGVDGGVEFFRFLFIYLLIIILIILISCCVCFTVTLLTGLSWYPQGRRARAKQVIKTILVHNVGSEQVRDRLSTAWVLKPLLRTHGTVQR